MARRPSTYNYLPGNKKVPFRFSSVFSVFIKICDVMGVLIQIFFVECFTVLLIGSNEFSQIIALTPRDQKLR